LDLHSISLFQIIDVQQRVQSGQCGASTPSSSTPSPPFIVTAPQKLVA
jgi:hypothetical protein